MSSLLVFKPWNTLRLVFGCCFLLLINVDLWAQVPQGIPYQSVARDANNTPLSNRTISLRFSILRKTVTGSSFSFTPMYTETQQAITNVLGLFTVNIGQGNAVSGTFSGINWRNGPIYEETEVDINGGTAYVSTGVQPLQSVPFALLSAKAENIPDGTANDQILMWDVVTSSWKTTTICSYFSTTANCGTCGNVCGPYPNAIPGCSGGACVIAACNTGFGNCDGAVSNGCEINLLTNTAHCGACNNVCTFANASASCSGGSCLLLQCNTGYANCNSSSTDGCEIYILSDAFNCGACGTVCSFANASAGCVSGACALSSCNSGFSNCNSLISDGCEINIASNANNCGACGSVCSSNNMATRTCTSGVCSGTCTSGFGDCNGDKLTDGCEVNLSNSIANCGACKTICSLPNATVACISGSCTLAFCNSGFASCNGLAADGCEVNVNTSVSNCGACGVVCSSNNISTPVCTSGACIGTCNSGFADCNANKQTDGCETNALTSVTNCGACGVVCSTSNITRSCTSGVCTGTCTTGFADCNANKQTDGCEVNINTSVSNCGSCGIVCSSNNIATPVCSSGSCAGTCNSGFADCNLNKQADGCEVNITISVSNCGSCGSVCSSNNIATPVCSSGVCTGTCNSGFADCNLNKQADGCEVNITTSVSNCGSCGSVCSSNNIATPVCSSGSCTGTCNAGFADCNANKRTDGCEVNTNTNSSNCGTCGNVCPTGKTCSSGACI